MIDVIGEVGSIPTDERKNSRTPRVHPVQPEEINPRTGGNATLLDRSALGIDNWQLHPVEAKAISVRPDNGADALFAKTQRADTVDTERGKRRRDFCLVEFGTHVRSGGQLVRRLNEGRVTLVGGCEQSFGIVSKSQCPIAYAQNAP